MKLTVNETAWGILSEEAKGILSKKAEIVFEEDKPTNCVFCHKEMSRGQLGFCMPCLIKNDPQFWKDYKKSKEGEKKR